jgi:hypothetical protein
MLEIIYRFRLKMLLKFDCNIVDTCFNLSLEVCRFITFRQLNNDLRERNKKQNGLLYAIIVDCIELAEDVIQW